MSILSQCSLTYCTRIKTPIHSIVVHFFYYVLFNFSQVVFEIVLSNLSILIRGYIK